jgi:hypothetical protein
MCLDTQKRRASLLTPSCTIIESMSHYALKLCVCSCFAAIAGKWRVRWLLLLLVTPRRCRLGTVAHTPKFVLFSHAPFPVDKRLSHMYVDVDLLAFSLVAWTGTEHHVCSLPSFAVHRAGSFWGLRSPEKFAEPF